MSSLQGTTANPPACTCGALGDPHGICCMVTAWSQPHAMVTNEGDVFYPDNEDDARHFAAGFDAKPLRPDVFPFDLGGDP